MWSDLVMVLQLFEHFKLAMLHLMIQFDQQQAIATAIIVAVIATTAIAIIAVINVISSIVINEECSSAKRD